MAFDERIGASNDYITINPNGDIKNVHTGEITKSPDYPVSFQKDIELNPVTDAIPQWLTDAQEAENKTKEEERTVKQNYWDNPDKVKANFNSFDEAMKDDDAQRYNKFQESGTQEKKLNTLDELRDMLSKEESKRQEAFANDVKKEVSHGDAISSNKNANEGFNNLKPLSEDGKDFFARQEEIANKAKVDAAHQEALDSNRKANEGFNNLKPLSDTGKDFFAKQDEIANKAKLDAAHQEALDSNRKANEGFDPLKPFSQTGQDALAWQDEFQKSLRKPDPEIPDPEKPNPEILELQERVTRIEEQLAALQAQLDLILERLNNINPVEPPVPPIVEPPVPPIVEPPVLVDVPPVTVINEDRDKVVITPEQARRDRNIKRGAMIAGAVTGFGTVILGGTAVVPVVGGIVVGAQVATWGTKKFAEWRERRLEDRLITTTDQQEREKIEKRIDTWKKVRANTEIVKKFFRGASYGVLAGSFVSGVFMGGEGVIDKIAHARAASAENFSQVSAGVNANSAPTTPTPGTPTTPMTPTPEIPTEGVLVQNGHVNLPGSAWNGNLAGQAQPNLDILNHSSYTGGIHEMAPRMLENDLLANGVTRDTLLNNLGERGIHSLLNNYLETIRAGVTDPNLVDVLNSMGSEGAKNIVNTIVGPK